MSQIIKHESLSKVSSLAQFVILNFCGNSKGFLRKQLSVQKIVLFDFFPDSSEAHVQLENVSQSIKENSLADQHQLTHVIFSQYSRFEFVV